MDKQERIAQLEREIAHHDRLYHDDDTPEISDGAYDALKRELASLAPGHALLFSVGDADQGELPQPKIQMGSIAKAFSAQEVLKWYCDFRNRYSGRKFSLVISPKMDGLSCRLEYENGKLVLGASRGNKDVTPNVGAIADIPKFIAGYSGEVRGEVFMEKNTLKEINADLASKNKQTFANVRNAAAGSFKNSDPAVTASRKLRFLAYEIIPADGGFKSETEKTEWAKKNGVPYVKVNVVPDGMIDEFLKKAATVRPSLPYQVDGMVFSINECDPDEYGWTGKCPNWKLAYKFPPEEKLTKAIGIGWQVGRTGKITPVAKLEPVEVDGSIVSSPTLHNVAQMKKLGFRVGCTVKIAKAGDIIPQVIAVTADPEDMSKDWHASVEYPFQCPSCGSDTVCDDTFVMCPNPACKARAKESVMNWITTLDLKGVGDATIEALFEAGHLKSIPDLYRLDKSMVTAVTGGDRAADVVLSAIASRKTVSLATFLHALGIPNLGNTMGKLLAKNFKTLAAVRSASSADFIKLEGIGDVTSAGFASGLSGASVMIDDLLKYVAVEECVEKGGPLKGMSFCITGSLSRNKAAVYAEIEAKGGEAWSSVKKGLTYLIQADATSKSEKSEKARKIGVAVIGETELNDLLSK